MRRSYDSLWSALAAASAVLGWLPTPVLGQDPANEVALEIRNANEGRWNWTESHVPIRFEIPAEHAQTLPKHPWLVDGRQQPVVPLQIMKRANGAFEAHCVVPCVGDLATARFAIAGGAAPTARFKYTADDATRTLFIDGTPRVRHERLYDAAKHKVTFKHFDSVFGLDGEMLTKMAGGKFGHHRGIFVGWNRVRHDGNRYDFWHSPKGEKLVFESDVSKDECTGPHCARRVVNALWQNKEGETIVRERRVLDVWAPEAGRLVVDVDVTLVSESGPVELRGDAHHAGVQIRLSNELVARQKQTRYLRSEGAKAKKNDVWVDTDWAAILCTLQGRRWAILHHTLEMPSSWQYSTRPYGRFGSFCQTVLEASKPQRFRVRIEFFDLARTPFDAGRAVRLHELAKRPPAVRFVRGG